MQIKRIGKKESIVSGIKNFRGQNKRAIIKNGVSDDGLIMCLAPCFKSGGFDIYSNRRIARELDALLACLGLEKPVLIRQRPIGIRQQDGYFYKIVSGVKRNGDLHKGKE
jgi:hypothetical protein